MVIAGIHIDGFGKLHDLDIRLERGINILSGANEAGKSTLHIFLRSLLYGANIKRIQGKPSVYERMRPWKNPSRYGGFLDVYKNGTLYRISRDFNKSPDDIGIVNLFDKKDDIFDKDVFMRELVSGLSEAMFLNTASAGQLSAKTDKNMSRELKEYAENIQATANPRLNADKAIEYLEKIKLEAERKIDPDAAHKYNVLLTQKKDLYDVIRDPARENRIAEYTSAHEQAHDKAGETALELSKREMAISDREKTLADIDIKNEDDIDSLGTHVSGLYKKSRDCALLAIILGVLGVCFIAACFFIMPSDFYLIVDFTRPRTIAALTVGIAGVGMVIIVIVLLVVRNARIRKLVGILEKHTGKVEKGVTPNLSDKMSAFYDKLGQYKNILSEIDSLKKERSSLTESLKGLNELQSEYLKQIEEQRKIKSGVEEDIGRLVNAECEVKRLEGVLNANKDLREDIDAILMAQETLKKLSADIKNSVGTYINKEAGTMMAGLTGGAYDSLDAGAQYDITINGDMGFISYEYMSRGTIDQIYLAVRIATLRFMAGKDDPVPLFLDDSFVLFDDVRLSKALKFLANNYKGQILMFTCQNREEKILRDRGVPYFDYRLQ